MNIFSFSRPTIRLLLYGIFSVLCHATAIFLYATTLPLATPLTFHHTVFPMIEHSLVSLIAIFIGALGFEYIEKEKRS